MFSLGDPVYRLDSGLNAATVIDIVDDFEGRRYHIVYAEGGEGWWPESALFPTLADRDAALLR